MEKLRKGVDVRLITIQKKLIKIVSKPTYVSSKIFNENLVSIHKIKEVLTLNRPAYVGMCMLELSKNLIDDFHYNTIMKMYGYENAKLLFTDTDSLMYEIKAEDVYNDFYKKKDLFDNSDYSIDSPFYLKVNKNEAAGIPIVQFIGLQSKIYSQIKDNEKGGKTAKGVKKKCNKKRHYT